MHQRTVMGDRKVTSMDRNTFDFSGQVAIVTGGGRGLGREMARALAAAGAAVAVVARTQSELDETADLIARDGGKVLAICADVTDAAAMEQMARQVEQELGGVTLLINNAGVVCTPSPIWETDPDEWRRVIDVNLNGAFLCARAVLPGMIQRRRGRIINISSGAGAFPVTYGHSYSVAKTALARFSECLALDTKDYGISAFTIDPGLVLTAMLSYLVESEAGRTYMPWAQEAVAAGQNHSAQLPTDLVMLLASGKADALSGRFIGVFDGIDTLLRNEVQIAQADLYTLRLGKLPL
jgi:NAD(P)-dependent dehydrogenase (short-subunit alcohol dehydrogenase family)